MHFEINLYVAAAIFPFLLYAAITDWRFRIIKLWTAPSIFIAGTAVSYISTGRFDLTGAILGGALALLGYGLAMWLFGTGGGDLLMMSALGWVLGLVTFSILVWFASLWFAVVMAIVKRSPSEGKQRKTGPYAPAVFAGFVSIVLLSLILSTTQG